MREANYLLARARWDEGFCVWVLCLPEVQSIHVQMRCWVRPVKIPSHAGGAMREKRSTISHHLVVFPFQVGGFVFRQRHSLIARLFVCSGHLSQSGKNPYPKPFKQETSPKNLGHSSMWPPVQEHTHGADKKLASVQARGSKAPSATVHVWARQTIGIDRTTLHGHRGGSKLGFLPQLRQHTR